MKIDDLYVGQLVRMRETDEVGGVHKIDYDENMVWVDVQLSNGRIDRVDVDPDDLKPKD